MITPVRRGEIVNVPNAVYNRVDPIMVLSQCTHRMVGLYCDSHDVHCSLADFVEHVQIDEPHRVALWCPECRCYREPDAAQLSALDPHPSNP